MWGNYEEQDEPGKRKKKPIEELLPTPEVSPNASPIHNHVDNTPSNNRGKRIQRNKERAKCYRDNEKLRKEIEKQQRSEQVISCFDYQKILNFENIILLTNFQGTVKCIKSPFSTHQNH